MRINTIVYTVFLFNDNVCFIILGIW